MASDTTRRSVIAGGVLGAAAGLGLAGRVEAATSAEQVNYDANHALTQLYALQPRARELARRSVAMLVFPKIYKGGLVVGGLSGNGVLRINGKADGYFNISAASFGLQAGVQSYSLIMFFMTASALTYLHTSQGWAIGSGPSVVVMDKGAAANVSSTTLSQDVYAIPFGQKGLMAGIGLEGSKITQIKAPQ